jgi:hypothetical protein
MNTLQTTIPQSDDQAVGSDEQRRAARRGGVRARRHSQRRRLSRNDVVFRTASGVTLIAAGPSDRSQRWFRNPIPRRSPAA